jgi:hypothetical protein
MSDDAPATKGDLADLEKNLRVGLRKDLADFEARFVTALREMETRLLRAFSGASRSE